MGIPAYPHGISSDLHSIALPNLHGTTADLQPTPANSHSLAADPNGTTADPRGTSASSRDSQGGRELCRWEYMLRRQLQSGCTHATHQSQGRCGSFSLTRYLIPPAVILTFLFPVFILLLLSSHFSLYHLDPSCFRQTLSRVPSCLLPTLPHTLLPSRPER